MANGECVGLFIDNSNIFIEGQKYFAKKLNLRVPKDPCFRIDIGKLCVALLDTRTNDFGMLYGSEPPSLDTVWKKIRQGGLNVSTYKRNSKDKEKEVDNALTADATEYVCERTIEGKTGVVVLVAGDRDYCPVVKKILKKHWKVELVAFSSSINKKYEEMQNSSEGLKITKLEHIFDNKPHLYFVNRKFKVLRSNSPRRNKIPRSRTMVMEFQSQFDAVSDKNKLRAIAGEITSTLRIPCRFHANSSRNDTTNTLFIIGLLRTQSEKLKEHEKKKRESEEESMQIMRNVGIPEETIQQVIHYQRSNQPEPPVEYIDFCSVWGENRKAISDKCKEQFGGLSSDKTYVNYLESPNGQRDSVEIQNRYDPLVGDSEESSSDRDDTDYDYDIDDDFENDRQAQSSSGIDTQTVDAADSNAQDWTLFEEVQRKKKPKCGSMFSESCKYGFNCKNPGCGYKHSKIEKDFIKQRISKQTRYNFAYDYKSMQCASHIDSRACDIGKAEKEPMCPRYHSLSEARCYLCNKDAGAIGHTKDTCTKARDSVVADCRYKYSCSKGLSCREKHTEAEKKVFESNNGVGYRSYKSKPCGYRDCNKGAALCPFYHSKKEARCYKCTRFGGAEGHEVFSCSKQTRRN